MDFHHVRLGQGKPLVLFQSLSSTWNSWQPILDGLAGHRTVIALDLPGSAETPRLPGPVAQVAGSIPAAVVSAGRVHLERGSMNASGSSSSLGVSSREEDSQIIQTYFDAQHALQHEG